MADKKEINANIPLNWLLIMATRGDMGSDKLPMFIQQWARKLLVDNGYQQELRKNQMDNINALRNSVSKVVGKDGMQLIDKTVNEAKAALQFARGEHSEN